LRQGKICLVSFWSTKKSTVDSSKDGKKNKEQIHQRSLFIHQKGKKSVVLRSNNAPPRPTTDSKVGHFEVTRASIPKTTKKRER